MAKGKNQTILDVVTGISQAMTMAHDGALDQDGEKIEIGLNREVGNPIVDSRLMDGFSCRMQGQFLILTYQADLKIAQVQDKKFIDDMEDMLNKIVKFLKKQYKAFTKKALSLSPKGETQIKVERMSNVRTWATVQKIYKIGSVDLEDEGDNAKLDKAIENWLSKSTTKRPSNEHIKPSDNEKEEK